MNVPSILVNVEGSAEVRYRIISDHLGSVRFVLRESDGSVVQQLRYDEYGVVLEDTNPGFQPFGYAGGFYDADTGLVRFGARDYDSGSGRWLKKDPIGISNAFNLYQYSYSNPVVYLDPIGESPHDAALINRQYLRTRNRLIDTGQRLPGSGWWNGFKNNRQRGWLPSDSNSHKVKDCWGQSEAFLDDLNKASYKFDDKWEFRIAQVPGHSWVEAIPSNPNDPMMSFDMWRDSRGTLSEPTRDYVRWHIDPGTVDPRQR